MNAKLTLRLDADIIRLAKEHSRAVGKPVSQMVEDFFRAVTSRVAPAIEDTPTVRELRGAMEGHSVEEADYRRFLEDKYL